MVPDKSRPPRFGSMDWAIDGPGQWLQGRPLLGIAFALMILPVVVNTADVYLLGYSSDSAAYKLTTWVTIVFWLLAAGYLATFLVVLIYRLPSDIRKALRSRKADNSTEP